MSFNSDFADSALGNESPPIPHQQFDSECDMSPPGGNLLLLY